MAFSVPSGRAPSLQFRVINAKEMKRKVSMEHRVSMIERKLKESQNERHKTRINRIIAAGLILEKIVRLLLGGAD